MLSPESDCILDTNKQEYEAALAKVEEAIGIIPENPAGYNDKAQILRIQRKETEAIQSLNKVNIFDIQYICIDIHVSYLSVSIYQTEKEFQLRKH